MCCTAQDAASGRGISGPSWTDFTWFSATLGTTHLAKGAILLPIRIDGLPGAHFVHLDLGAHVNYLHEKAIRAISPAFDVGSARARATSGDLGHLRFVDERFEVLRDDGVFVAPGVSMPTIGTIGLPFVRERLLLIDYPRTRFALLDRGVGLPADALAAFTFVKAIPRDGKLYVQAAVNGAADDTLFFDTGAAFPLTVEGADWKVLTGRDTDDPTNTRISTMNWDAPIDLVGAPLQGTFTVGPATLTRPMVFVATTPGFSFSNFHQTRGVFGNPVFADAFIVLVDVPGQRLGLARTLP